MISADPEAVTVRQGESTRGSNSLVKSFSWRFVVQALPGTLAKATACLKEETAVDGFVCHVIILFARDMPAWAIRKSAGATIPCSNFPVTMLANIRR
ncbi:hypothetical protein ACLKMY_39970 [Paraburkholderia mimosarum]|uniref:hypothetical protein n=1 Tax=Paraburkholderia mimosarum TaxID=312026 RepID=UPI0039C174C4